MTQRRPNSFVHFLDEAVGPMRWKPLSMQPRMATRREIRITTGNGMVYHPREMLRLVEESGRVVGESLLVWEEDAVRTPLPSYSVFRPERLRALGYLRPRRNGGRVACPVESAAATHWTRVAAQLEAIGAWHPIKEAPIETETFVVDAQGRVIGETSRVITVASFCSEAASVLVQVLDRGEYRAYSVNDGCGEATPEAERAHALLRVLSLASSLSR